MYLIFCQSYIMDSYIDFIVFHGSQQAANEYNSMAHLFYQAINLPKCLFHSHILLLKRTLRIYSLLL